MKLLPHLALLASASCLIATQALSGQSHDILVVKNRSYFSVDAIVPFVDLDGDGHTDFLVGENNAIVDRFLQGVVELRSGSDGSLLRQSKGDTRSRLGGSITVLDDIDGDRFPDYAVGATEHPWDGSRRGRGSVFLYSGKSGKRLSVINGNLLATATFDLGHQIVVVDDYDSDGIRDFVTCTKPASRRSEIFLISAKRGTVIRRIENSTDSFGTRIALGHDANKDGKRDLWTSALFQKGVSLLSLTDGRVLQTISGITFGSADGHLDASSDLDGDGIADVVLGSLREPIRIGNGSSTTGAIYAISSARSTLIWKHLVRDFTSGIGQSFCSVSDCDGDRVRDFVVGGSRMNQVQSGFVQTISGKAGRVLETRRSASSDLIGRLVTAAGDLNGDGVEDYFALATRYPSGAGTIPAIRVQSSKPLSFASLDRHVPLLTGGFQRYELDAGKARAGALAILLGSASGRSPGLRIGGLQIPLNPDAYFGLSLSSPRAFLFNNLVTLDPNGRAQAGFRLPAGYSASLAGTMLHHAFVTIDPPNVTFASNAVPLRFTLF